MKKKMRCFTAFIMILMLTVTSVLPTFASEITNGNSQIEFTEDLAIQMGERFAKAIVPNSDIIADNPVKFYDENGQAIGYIVNYYKESESYGYVIFDTTNEDLISEYSFGEKSKSPYEMICGLDASLFRSEKSDNVLYRIAPFTYGIVNDEENIRTNYGEIVEKDAVLSLRENRSSKPITWDTVLLDIKEVYEDYTLSSTNHLDQFISFEDGKIMSATGHYACAVTALLACAVYYNASNSSNYQINAEDYMSIWDLTRTTVSGQRDGIVLGTTQVGYIGPRFVDFCAGKGIVVTQKTEYGAKYDFFTSCIDGGNMAVVSCGIIESGTTSRVGHAMAVEGYALLQARNSGRILHTLMVYDGWNDNVRYMNFDFNEWTELDGIAFSR